MSRIPKTPHCAPMGAQAEVVDAACRAQMDASIACEHREFARLCEGVAA